MPTTRKRPAAKASSGRARSRPTATVRADVIAALRDEVAALARAVAAQTEAIERMRGPGAAPAGTPASLVARLTESAELLSATAAELPRADDFQPLADHLYAFAESAPRLLESLEAVRAAVAPLESAARSLGDVAETLVATHHGWSESLLRLPRAEDYEPLTEPLREFARVSPLLAETLSAVVKAVTPLPGMVQQVLGAAETLHPAVRCRASAPAASGGGGGPDGHRARGHPQRPGLAPPRPRLRRGRGASARAGHRLALAHGVAPAASCDEHPPRRCRRLAGRGGAGAGSGGTRCAPRARRR